jgi:UDP-glucuronate 4-epimerase
VVSKKTVASKKTVVSKKTVLVTGAAGFIGSHTAEALLRKGYRVVGLDNFNDYYDPRRKRENVEEVRAAAPVSGDFLMIEGDVRDAPGMLDLLESERPEAVVHLAAMAGVRVSIENPELYYDVNVQGTLGLLEAARKVSLPQFVLASTSSVYGKTERIPFVEDDVCDRPISPYSSSKRAAELLAYTYHHLYGLNVAIPRFFTVYGPRGRPDMMAYKVLDSIHFGSEVPLFNGGRMHRDWTYVDDIVAGVVAAAERPMGYEIFNLGRGEPVLLKDFVDGIEALAGRRANLVPKPMMSADVEYTYADTSKAARLLDYDPKVSVEEGIERFWRWYKSAVLT